MVFTLLAGLFGCTKAPEKTLTSVEEMTLTLQGMRGSSVYKFEVADGVTVLRRYAVRYSGEETLLTVEAEAECEAAAMTELMNSCGIPRWDGFHGEHPKNVHDGIMFRFEATVNGRERILADGSANFPDGYREFVRTLDEILAENKKNQ